MAEANSKQFVRQNKSFFNVGRIFFFALLVLAFLSILSYSKNDFSVLMHGSNDALKNYIGWLGAWFSFILFVFFGLGAYFLMALALLKAFRLLFGKGGNILTLTIATLLSLNGVIILLGLAPEQFASLCTLFFDKPATQELALSGGVIGQWLASPPVDGASGGWLRELIGAVGATVTGWTLFTAGAITLYFADWHQILKEHFATASNAPVDDSDDENTQTPTATIVAPTQPIANGASTQNPADATQGKGKNSLLNRLLRPFTEDVAQESQSTAQPNDNVAQPATQPIVANQAVTDGQNQQPEQIPQIIEQDEASDVVPPLAPTEVQDGKEVNEQEEIIEPEKIAPVTIPLQSNSAEQQSPKATAKNPVATQPTAPPILSTKIIEKGKKTVATTNEYTLPPISMLSQGASSEGEEPEFIAQAKETLQQVLRDFGIDGEVVNYISGPRVTRFELSLAPNVNVNSVEKISDNIQMRLAATSIRILAPIPGTPYVGIEMSNRKPGAVFMRRVMESNEWKSGKAEIPVALGMNIAGKPIILDIAKAPHMLIAGSTGTGKSVCSNSLIMSLLFKFTPDELKLIMVDPKVVEFADYVKLPHLITPVINDSNKTPLALRWAVNEMEKRYRYLAKAGVKKFSAYNQLPLDREPLYDDDGMEIPKRLPILLTIIDELGDLMLTEYKKDIENYITRIAQKGRAAGVHIVVATQRPDTKVITGNIKANLPTRICFQVRTLIDSRVILDASGGEKLLGKGDMLYVSPLNMNIERVQGSFVPDDDIKKVVDFVCCQREQEFNTAVMAEPIDDNGGTDIDGTEILPIDPEDRQEISPLVQKYLRPGDSDLIKKALEVVILDQKASTSYFQRRLGIGYIKAAEITDLLEQRGVIGPDSGSGKKREILIFDGLSVNNTDDN